MQNTMVQRVEGVANSISTKANSLICKHHEYFLHWFLEHVAGISSLTLPVISAVVHTYVLLSHTDIPVLRHDNISLSICILQNNREAVVLYCIWETFLAGLPIKEQLCYKTHYPSAAYFFRERSLVPVWSDKQYFLQWGAEIKMTKKTEKGGRKNTRGGCFVDGKRGKYPCSFLSRSRTKLQPVEKTIQGNSCLMQSEKALHQSHHLSSM